MIQKSPVNYVYDIFQPSFDLAKGVENMHFVAASVHHKKNRLKVTSKKRKLDYCVDSFDAIFSLSTENFYYRNTTQNFQTFNSNTYS